MAVMLPRLLGAVVGALCAWVVTAGTARAALVDQGLNTLDTATGLRWLDVTATVGMSYDAVLLGTYVVDFGYQFATEDQVIQLYNDVCQRRNNITPLAGVKMYHLGAAEDCP